MLSRIVSEQTGKLRARVVANAAEEAKILDRGLKEALGRQGSRRDRSAAGEAPRRQTGDLQANTKATAGADGSIVVTTTPVGVILDKKRDRPFLRIALDATRAERLAARFRRPR